MTSASPLPPERRHARSRYADIPVYQADSRRADGNSGSARRNGATRAATSDTSDAAAAASSDAGNADSRVGGRHQDAKHMSTGIPERTRHSDTTRPQETGRQASQKASRGADASRGAGRAPVSRRRTDGPHRRKGTHSATRGAVSSIARRPVLRIILSVIAVILVICAIDAAANWGKIYPGVHVGEVDVSGMTVGEAASAVDSHYGNILASNEVNIYADEESLQRAREGATVENPAESENISADEAAKSKKVWTTNASELGARVDSAALAQRALAVGRDDGGIFSRLAAQALGWTVDTAVVMDDAAVENLAYEIDRAIGNEHEDYGVTIEDGVASVTIGHAGREVNRDTLRREISQQLLGEAEEEGILAVAEDAAVHIDQATAQAAADHVNAAIAYGATFDFSGTVWEADASDLGNLVVTQASQTDEGWELVASYDESLAKSALLANLQSTYDEQNIKVQFEKSGDDVVVRTSASGTMPEAGAALESLEQQTLENPPASTPIIEVTGTQLPESMSVEEAMDYGLITTVSSFETEYTGGSTNRNTNIHLAADLIDNSIAKADGGTWSFNAVAGNCNEEKGFKNAGTIIGGEIVDDVGGGICQVATTVFNAVYEAGYPVDERTNHSLYMASYPAGRDAAVSWPDLDLVWRNDTGSDVLMQTSWTDTTVTVTLLGVDPGYTVSTEEGEFKEGAKYSTRTIEDDSLEEGQTELQQAGIDGSSIEVTRTVKDAAGNIVRQDTFSSVYDAQDEIIAVGPNTDVDSVTGDDSEDDESGAYDVTG